MIFLNISQLTGHLSNAHPYLDPGSGSILIQLLVAGLLGAGILLRVSWKKILKLFKRGQPQQNEDEEDE